ncbi:hypothetical protein TTMY_1199 [Thermus thermophilus]|nr:hypothetical protein TTMY_1199 [Thermus thermophilus]
MPLSLATPEGEVRPMGTHLRLNRAEGSRLSLYRGEVALGEGRLPAGEGAVLGTGVRKKLLPAPWCAPPRGRKGRWSSASSFPGGPGLPGGGAKRRGRGPLRPGEGGLFRYLPQGDRLSELRAFALDEVGLEGYPSDPVPFRERKSFYEGKRRLPRTPRGRRAS